MARAEIKHDGNVCYVLCYAGGAEGGETGGSQADRSLTITTTLTQTPSQSQPGRALIYNLYFSSSVSQTNNEGRGDGLRISMLFYHFKH